MRAVIILLLAFASLTVVQPALADARTEAGAREALKKAEGDYLGLNYGSGAARLRKAVKACGTTKCSAATRAALQRDIGAMLFRKNDADGANKAWAKAVKLQPGITMNPAYDAADIRSAFQAATGGAASAGGGAGAAAAGGGGGTSHAGGGPAAGDFTHTPAMEQKVNTPLPVYVEGAPAEVAVVVVKYKGATMSDWRRVDLDKVGEGWGGLIPCSDVTSGTMRYYIQGINRNKEPVANSGDAKHPFTVPIRDEITGDEPSLPGMKPPKACSGASADCPPDFPGCGKKGTGDEGASDKGEGEGEQGEGDSEGKSEEAPKSRTEKRLWIGGAIAIDFMPLPSGQNVCYLNPVGTPNAGQPANSAGYYCANADGSDFPARTPKGGMNNGLFNLNAGSAGTVSSQLALGNVRLLLSLDYALTSNILLGARLGLVLFVYPGASPNVDANNSTGAAINDGRAFSLTRLHAEVRGTYLFGKDPLVKGLAPMGFVGGGASEFDAHTSTTVALFPPNGKVQTGAVGAWRTGGPGFVLLGGGARYALSSSFGLTFAARLDLAFGGSGLVPTFGPELGAQYGF